MRNQSLLAFLFFLITSCAKSDDYIPEVPVKFRASLSDPRLSQLNSAGGAVSISGYGVAGLIIYRRGDNAYVAYDACSSVNPQQRCAIVIDDPNLTATDPCSGAKFSLYDGSAVKAPAVRSLKSYQVSVTSFEISVIN